MKTVTIKQDVFADAPHYSVLAYKKGDKVKVIEASNMPIGHRIKYWVVDSNHKDETVKGHLASYGIGLEEEDFSENELITYRDLIEILKCLPDERLDDLVTVYDVSKEEFGPICGTETIKEDGSDILNKGHFILKF